MDTASRLLMLLEVVEQGSFKKAAELRNVNRSVVSKQITRLEEELGIRLLNRTTRSFSLTAAGSEMVKKASELRFLMQDTLKVAENYHSEPRGLLRIAAAPLIGRRYLQPVINSFQKQFNQIEVELRMDSRITDIVSEGFDIAFRIGEPKDGSFIARKIARNRLVIAAAPSFLERYGQPQTMPDLAELPAATFISNHTHLQSLPYLDTTGRRCEQEIRSVYRANDGEVLVMKAVAGDAYFAGPGFILHDEIETGQLIPILTDTKLVEYSGMYAVYPHRDMPARSRLFLDSVREYIGLTTPIWERRIPGFSDMY